MPEVMKNVSNMTRQPSGIDGIYRAQVESITLILPQLLPWTMVSILLLLYLSWNPHCPLQYSHYFLPACECDDLITPFQTAPGGLVVEGSVCVQKVMGSVPG